VPCGLAGLQPIRWRQYVPPKCWYPLTSHHSSHKTTINKFWLKPRNIFTRCEAHIADHLLNIILPFLRFVVKLNRITWEIVYWLYIEEK
jgi:hypothetical protein